jgi:hypothetical protein
MPSAFLKEYLPRKWHWAGHGQEEFLGLQVFRSLGFKRQSAIFEKNERHSE